MKFKGQTIKSSKKQYSIKQQLGQGGFSVIYSTTDPQAICKVQVLNNPPILQAYKNQKQSLQQLRHKNIVELFDSFEIKEKDGSYGILILENCNSGNAHNILQKHQHHDVSQKLVFKIFYSVASALQFMHKKGIAHRDIKLQNVLLNSKNEFKLCDFGSSSKQIITNFTKQNRADIQQHIEKTTTPFYRSPQQLDLYSGYPIGTQVDIFALGVLIFMLCFKKPPFQSRLSSINSQYFIPQETSYSASLIELIKKCFMANPSERPKAEDIKRELKIIMSKKIAQIDINIQRQLDSTLSQILKINNSMLKKSTTVTAQSSIFDKLKRFYNQMTTQSQGWIAGFVQDNQLPPQLKYNRSIISKCWEKRYKVEKIYQILYKYSEDYKGKCLVNIKLLVLMHNFLRKGPAEAVSYDGTYSAQKLCSKIYKNWKMSQKSTDPDNDIKRNSYVCLVIRYYSIILMAKWKLSYENSDLIQANFSILPFLKSKHETAILKLPFIQELIRFLQICTQFHQILATHSYLVDIQRSIILSLVDQEYCCLSLLVFVLSAFKEAICHFSADQEELDLVKLQKKLRPIEKDFENVFNKLIKLFEMANKLASLFEEDTKFQINPKILGFIKGINIRQKKSGNFEFNKHINYKSNIFGLTIPLSYEQAVKNPNFLKSLQKKDDSNVVEINQFRVRKSSDPGVKKGPEEPSNQFPPGINDAKNEAFKKNKQHKIFSNNPFPTDQKIEQKVQKSNSNTNSLMQFTHQNLNRDMMDTMSHQVQNNQFKDFLSIVDQKYNPQNNVSVPKNDNPSNNSNNNQKGKKFDSLYSSNETKNKDFFNFNNFQTTSDYSKISSVNSQLSPKFNKQSQFQPPSSNPNQHKLKKDFEMFQTLDFTSKPQPIPNNSLKQQLSSVSKDIYNSVNSSKEINQKVELLNFFDDQEDSKPQEIVPDSSPRSVSNKELPSSRPLNKTSGEGFFPADQRQFKTMPSDYSFIDLKGFIVEEVKKNAEQYFIDFNSLKFGGKVGFGHSSEVFKGQWRGREVAIKRIKDNMSPSNAKEFKRQIMTSVKIRHHPNLVTLIGIAEFQSQYYIINEFCNGSTLFDFLHESNFDLKMTTKISIAKQIVRGMLFIHTNDPPIIHRDLKSLNVLLVNKYNGETEPQIKIADFGLSRDFASTYMTGTLGTYHWMAPEIFNNQPYSLKADVYSFSIVLWEILARSPPYTNLKNPQSLMKFITVENGRPDLNMIGLNCPYELKMLMIRCWDQHPQNRPNFKQILETLNNIQLN